MARAEHRRILLRLYEDVPTHQRILQWLDGYSGRGLQTILCEALAIGLPQYLGESADMPRSKAMSKMPAPASAAESVAEPVSELSGPVESVSRVPAFVESGQQGSAREALKQLFEKELAK